MSCPFLGFNDEFRFWFADEVFAEKTEDDEALTTVLFEIGVLVMSKEPEGGFSGSPRLLDNVVGPEDN